MALESATYISGLTATNPVGASDPKSQGDDHLRLIKSTLLNSFPGITGAVLLTHTELNYLDNITGVTGTGNVVLSNAPTLTGTAALANMTASGAVTVTGTVTAGAFSGAMSASNLTSGTIPDARIQASGVTQHQASLSIAETQIPDGSLLARIAGTETISGAWTFSTTPIKASGGAFPFYNSATNSGGSITVSASDASGTPAAGDLWFKYI